MGVPCSKSTDRQTSGSKKQRRSTKDKAPENLPPLGRQLHYTDEIQKTNTNSAILAQTSVETPDVSLIHSALVEKKILSQEDDQKADRPGMSEQLQEDSEASKQLEDVPKHEADTNSVTESDSAPIAGAQQTAWTEGRNDHVKSSSMWQKPVDQENRVDVTQEKVQYSSAVNFQASDRVGPHRQSQVSQSTDIYRVVDDPKEVSVLMVSVSDTNSQFDHGPQGSKLKIINDLMSTQKSNLRAVKEEVNSDSDEDDKIARILDSDELGDRDSTIVMRRQTEDQRNHNSTVMVQRNVEDDDSEDSDVAIIRKASVSAMNNKHFSSSLPQDGAVEIENIFQGSARDAYDRQDNGSDYSETNVIKLQSSQDSRSLASSHKLKLAQSQSSMTSISMADLSAHDAVSSDEDNEDGDNKNIRRQKLLKLGESIQNLEIVAEIDETREATLLTADKANMAPQESIPGAEPIKEDEERQGIEQNDQE